MQRLNENRSYSPHYVDKIVLFFTPSGGIVVRIGNQHLNATSADVAELIKGRLDQHQMFVDLFNRGSQEDHHE